MDSGHNKFVLCQTHRGGVGDGLDAEPELPADQLDKVPLGGEAVEGGEDGGGREEGGRVVGEGVVGATEDEDGLGAAAQLAQVGLGEDGLGAQPRDGVV